MIRQLSVAFAATVLIGLPGTSPADDTDIYINPLQKAGSEPLVMFTIDTRSSVNNQGQFPSGSAPVIYFRTHPGTCAEFAGGCGTGTKNSIIDLFDYLRLSLKAALKEFECAPTDTTCKGVKVGLGLMHDNQNKNEGFNSGGSNGGYIAYGFNKLGTDGVARLEIDARLQKISQIVTAGGNAGKHSYQYGEWMFEFYRYLTGKAIYNGHNGCSDFDSGGGDKNCSKVAPDAKNVRFQHCPACWDDTEPGDTRVDTGLFDDKPHAGQTPVENAANTHYVSPLIGGNCASVYTINFANGQTNQDSDSNDAIKLAPASGGLAPITIDNQPAEEIIRKLNLNDLGHPDFGLPDIPGDQNVTSYFLYSGQAGREIPLMATAGGTDVIDYTDADFDNDPDFLVEIISKVLRQILDVSTTFVAASAPVNVFNRTQTLEDLYISIFQPDGETRPFWFGNVKKLRLNTSNVLVDTTGASAINPLNGRIDENAITYWTDTTKLPIGDGRVREGEALPLFPNSSPVTDGRQVNRGGAGQIIPGQRGSSTENTGSPGSSNDDNGARQLFFDNAAGTDLVALNDSDATAGLIASSLGAANTTEARELIRYMRGQLVENPTDDPDTTQARNWIMGDPLHARPLPINYGAKDLGGGTVFTDTNPAVFIAVAGNDGFLRLIQDKDHNGNHVGKEVWAFIPQKAMGIQKSLRANQQADPPVHPYSLDGNPTALFVDNGGDGTISGANDKVVLFIGMRRGGKAYYAVDITDPLDPDLVWRIDASQADFQEMGLAFSTPKIGKVRTSENVVVPALFFAGGYNTNKDSNAADAGSDDPQVNANHAQSDNGGRAIFVVNADNGTLIWKAVYGANTAAGATTFMHSGMLDSMPSDVGIFDTDADGLVDRLIVGDTGGNVWRADFPSGTGITTANWTVNLLARLGRHYSNTQADDRRFFNAPVLSQTYNQAGTAIDAVLLGSGDREDPLDRSGDTRNYFYMLADPNIGVLKHGDTVSALPFEPNDLADLTNNCLQDGVSVSCNPNLNSGWMFELTEASSGASEKNLSTALVIGGVVFFTTYLPPSPDSTCLDDQGVQIPCTCGLAEGNGLVYAVKLANATAAYDEEEYDQNEGRAYDLVSGGIPPELVLLQRGPDPTCTENCEPPPPCILDPSGDCEEPPTTRFPTFWQRVEEAP